MGSWAGELGEEMRVGLEGGEVPAERLYACEEGGVEQTVWR
jgi:hypothetical protein